MLTRAQRDPCRRAGIVNDLVPGSRTPHLEPGPFLVLEPDALARMARASGSGVAIGRAHVGVFAGMHSLLCEFWKDERGSLLVREWVFVATILVLGLLPTVVSIRARMQEVSTEANLSNEVSATFSYGIETGNSTPEPRSKPLR
jgi:hypothetical protein